MIFLGLFFIFVLLSMLMVFYLITGSTFSVLGKNKHKPKSDNKKSPPNPIYPNQYHAVIVPRIQKLLNNGQSDGRVGHGFYHIMLNIAKQDMAVSGLSLVCVDDDGWISWADTIAGRPYRLAVYHNLTDGQYWLRIVADSD